MYLKLEENGLVNPVTQTFEWNSFYVFNDKYKNKYKYIGKEKIDGKTYIKFSIESKNSVEKTIYYVDLQDRTMSKIERYSGQELISILSYTYSYNTVTDEDVAKFNINNYSEYQYIEEIK